MIGAAAVPATGVPSGMPIDTASVANRRHLTFQTSREALSDAETLAAADRAGTLSPLGNWTLGQALGHCASWIDYAYDGYPPELKAPWFVRIMVRLMKGSFLRKPLPSGFRIPRAPGGTFATDVLPTEAGLANFRQAWARLEREAPTMPSPVFGSLSHDEWRTMHLRHAELHLSFFTAKQP